MASPDFFDIFDFQSLPMRSSHVPPSATPARALPPAAPSSTRVGLSILAPKNPSPDWGRPESQESPDTLRNRYISKTPESSFVIESLENPVITLNSTKKKSLSPTKSSAETVKPLSDDDLFEFSPIPEIIEPRKSFLSEALKQNEQKTADLSPFSQEEREAFRPNQGGFGGLRRTRGGIFNLSALADD